MWDMDEPTYEELLEDKRWQEVRNRILRRISEPASTTILGQLVARNVIKH